MPTSNPLYPNPLTPAYLLGAVKSRPVSFERQGYLGRKLMPEKPVYEYQLAWDVIKAENQLGGIYAMNGKPIPGSDMLFSQMFADVVNLMAGKHVDPQSVMTLRDPGMSNIRTRADQAAATKARKKVANSLGWCDDRIEALVEYLIMNSLQGQVDWPPPQIAPANWEPQFGNATFNITYPLRSTFKQPASTLTTTIEGKVRNGAQVTWDAAGADPMKDLEVISEYITETTGVSARGSTLIMGTSVLSYMTENTKVLTRIAGTERGIDWLNVPILKDWLRDRLGFKIVEYDAKYTYRTNEGSADGPTINQVRFLPRGRVIILPPGEEKGYFATAPHAGPDDAYKPGKYTWLVKDREPPFETRLGVGQIGWPVMQLDASSIFVLDAWS
jgi:hypothetical protein